MAEAIVAEADVVSEKLPTEKSHTQQDAVMSKEDRARRSALLQEKRDRMKQEHDEEIAVLEEEISYQTDLLRYRREQKRQERHRETLRERLASLQRMLENDEDFETDGEDESSEAGDENNEDGASEVNETPPTPPSPVPEDQECNATSCVKNNEDSIDNEPNTWPLAFSQAKKEWDEQKKNQELGNAELDSMMDMVGLEQVKAQFMVIRNLVDTARRQDADLTTEAFGAIFMGSPGTGKTTVAGLYARFLSSMDIVPGSFNIKHTTGSHLFDGGVSECKKIIDSLETIEYEEYSGCEIDRSTRGVVFIDEAQNLAPSGVNSVFRYLVEEIRRLQGSVVFLFAGPTEQMQTFMALSPSLGSLVPFTFKFDDFGAGELHEILVRQLRSKFQSKMCVEGGVNGLPMRILIRRISRGSGSGYFANAREVQNTILRILLRQASRLSRNKVSPEQAQEEDEEQAQEGHQEKEEEEERKQKQSGDMFLTQADLLGDPPQAALESSTAWKQLQGLVGLDSVKKSVSALVSRLQVNFDRELAEKPLVEGSLSKVFLGNPGTGKTTVAKYYAQILADLGLLSSGEIIFKSSNDFVGEYLGSSEVQTKAILDSARGKVLVIDEAYGFSREDSFMSAVVDTIVAEVQATATEDRAVLLLGHTDEMKDMFQRVNPGLSRRFPLSSAFVFQDYSDDELRSILQIKIQTQGFTVSEEAKIVAMDVLKRSRNRHNFGNASEIDILLDKAKAAQQTRLNQHDDTGISLNTELTERDFDAEFNRSDRAESNITDAFAQFVGAEKLVSQFQGYLRIVQNSKHLGLDPRDHIPFNYIFRGPPGTGKTTTARKMGQIFFDLGFLATNEVEVCSASELIGEYVGHTGPKTQKIFQKTLGKVLFIDEAYRLGHGSFGKEAVGELVNILTLPKYKNKLVTVIAGYDRDINRLLASNPGFGSRFPEVLEFPGLSPKECRELLVRQLEHKKLDVSCMRLPWVFQKIEDLFQTLSDLPDWGNARDVENLATALFGRIISAQTSPPKVDVRAEWVYEKMNEIIAERRKRSQDAGDVGRSPLRDEVEETPGNLVPGSPIELQTTLEPPVSRGMMRKDTKTEAVEADLVDTQAESQEGERETGVTNETWLKLKESKLESNQRRKDFAKLNAEIHRIEAGIDLREAHAKGAGMDLSPPDIMARKLSLMKAELEKSQPLVETEEKIQRLLKESGLCEMGYEWIQENNGYRCAGGFHFKSHDDISRDYHIPAVDI